MDVQDGLKGLATYRGKARVVSDRKDAVAPVVRVEMLELAVANLGYRPVGGCKCRMQAEARAASKELGGAAQILQYPVGY